MDKLTLRFLISSRWTDKITREAQHFSSDVMSADLLAKDQKVTQAKGNLSKAFSTNWLIFNTLYSITGLLSVYLSTSSMSRKLRLAIDALVFKKKKFFGDGEA